MAATEAYPSDWQVSSTSDKETTFEKEQEKSHYEYKIVELTEKKEELEASIIETDAQILATHEDLNVMEATLTEENAVFKQAKSDDEAAVPEAGLSQ